MLHRNQSESKENMTNEDPKEGDNNLQEIKERNNNSNDFAISYCKASEYRKVVSFLCMRNIKPNHYSFKTVFFHSLTMLGSSFPIKTFGFLILL